MVFPSIIRRAMPPETLANVRAAASSFANDDSGATTVDWVILAAAITGLSIGTVAAMRSGSNDLAQDINSSLSGASVAYISGVDPNLTLGEMWVALSTEYDQLRVQTAAMTDFELRYWLDHYSTFMQTPDSHVGTGYSQEVYRDVYASLQVEFEDRGNTLPDGHYDSREYLSIIG